MIGHPQFKYGRLLLEPIAKRTVWSFESGIVT